MYGLHIDSDPKNICNQLIKYKKMNCIQLFVDISGKYKDEYIKFKNIYVQQKQNIIVHLSYTINIGRIWNEHSWWITQCIMEIDMANNLGAKYVVLHLGKSLGIDKNLVFNNMYSSLLYISHKIKNMDIKILLETSSGQGSETCVLLDDFALFSNKLFKNTNKNISSKFGICVDTCHIYNAGYDISTTKKVIDYLKEFDDKIGLEHIKLIHLNNSKTDKSSNTDRHDNLERGKINIEGIKEIIKFSKKLDIPLILETPYVYVKEDIEFMKLYYKVL